MRKRTLSLLLAVAMVIITISALPVFAAETVTDLNLGTGARNSVNFGKAYSGNVTLRFNLNVSSGNGYLKLWFFPSGQGGSEADVNGPDFQVEGSGGIWLMESEKIGSLPLDTNNQIEIVIDLSQKQYTVAVNGAAASTPVPFTGSIANIAGFDYRLFNEKTASITNMTVEEDESAEVPTVTGGGYTDPNALTVGPNGQFATLADALATAVPGDVIEIDAAGDYLGIKSNATIAVDDITIRGVNGRPLIGYADRSGTVPVTSHKGIWVAAAKNLTIENIEFQNAHDVNEVDGCNYCAVRIEPVADSTVIFRNCYIHGCDNGSLVGEASGMTVKMENCEFNDSGFGMRYVGDRDTPAGTYDFLAHSMYMGRIENFYLEHSIVRNVKAQGHLVKTRAKNNYIRYNFIAEETTSSGHSSNSNIDIPEGGNLYVIGNVLQQGLRQPNVGNPRMISYASEGANNADTLVVFANNTIINDQTSVSNSVINLHMNNGKTYSTDNVVFVNNVYQGYLNGGTVPLITSVGSGGTDMTAAVFTAANGNHIYDLSKKDDEAYAAANDPKFVNPTRYNYTLQEDSPLIDKGVAHAPVNGVSLVPEYQTDIVVVADHTGAASMSDITYERTVIGNGLDIGAYEYGIVPVADPDPGIETNPDPDAEVPQLPMGSGMRASYRFDQAYEGTVTFDFDLKLNDSNARFEMWLVSEEAFGSEDIGKPYLQFTAGNGALWLQDAVRAQSIAYGVANHLQVVVDLPSKTYTVSVSGGTPTDPVPFSSSMANVTGFDYRLQFAGGSINNMVVSSVGSGGTGSGSGASSDLTMPAGIRTYCEFGNTYQGTVTFDFDLTLNNSDARFEMWMVSDSAFGYEDIGKPYLQFTAGNGALWLQDSVKAGNITYGVANHVQVVIDLAGNTYTVSLNGGDSTDPVAYSTAMANVTGFDYRLQNAGGKIANMVVNGENIGGSGGTGGGSGASSDLTMPAGMRTYYEFGNTYQGTVTFDFDLTLNNSDARFEMWMVSDSAFGYEDIGKPYLQFTAGNGALWLQDSVKAGNITYGVANHVQVVIDLAGNTYTVSLNGGEPTDPVAYSTAMANVTGFDYRLQNAGGKIANMVVSSGDSGADLTLQLFKQGMSEPTYETVVKGDTVQYSIEGVAAGTYTLKASKKNYVTRTYTVVVGNDGKVTLDVKVCLIGDVNGDGKISAVDKKLIYDHIESSKELTEYAFDVADVSNDGKISAVDKKMVYSHINGDSSLWT